MCASVMCLGRGRVRTSTACHSTGGRAARRTSASSSWGCECGLGTWELSRVESSLACRADCGWTRLALTWLAGCVWCLGELWGECVVGVVTVDEWV